MIPATRPAPRGSHRLLWIDPVAGTHGVDAVAGLPDRLRPGDLVVVNDAATLPASLPARSASGAPVEIRLAGGAGDDGTFPAVLFGGGDWRLPTEDRPPPPRLASGDRLRIGGSPPLDATVASVDPDHPRLVALRFHREGAALHAALHRHGGPVQYSYLEAPLAPWDVATVYAGPPVAAEAPSAGLPLTWGILRSLRARGVGVVPLTHAAGLSSTGDAALDGRLPLPECSSIPASTVAAVTAVRAAGGRIVAVGTTVVRALEGRAAASGGTLVAGEAVTDLVLGPGHRLQVVDGLLTGLHETGASHLALLAAFAPAGLVEAAYDRAGAAGLRWHELGDVCLVLPG